VPSSVESNEIARVLSEGCSFGVLNEGFRQLSQALELDYLFIDTHPGLNKETLLSIAVSNLVMLILRPDRQDFQGTAVTVEVARQLKARQLLLVLNKVLPSMNVELLRQQIETTYDAPLAGIFPAAEEMMQLGSDGVFCLKYPDHPFSQALTQLVKRITSAH
jgi:MinD-like ATPase involved in chromosome partitioning or flagellar assembly